MAYNVSGFCPPSDSDDELAHRPWFYGSFSRAMAEEVILKNGTIGSFLIRTSESNPGV